MALQTVMMGKPRRPKVDAAVGWIKEHRSEGDLITHEDMARMLDDKPASPSYYGMVQGVRRLLLDQTGVFLEVVRSDGYQLCRGGEQLDAGNGQFKQSVRRMRRSLAITGAVTDDRLTVAQRDARDFLIGKIKTASELAKIDSRQMTLKLGKPETMPQ